MRERPSPSNKAACLNVVFDMARESTGWMLPEDRTAWLEWLDRIQAKDDMKPSGHRCGRCRQPGHNASSCTVVI